ncbi:unnamed protein product [Cuscuta epithymum]|uniref:Uncharacterized protein n=1 Tax=Cuscuta epithymum TaxID=186058 RepID=A0AAV0GI32_9ASTE|nr:unnamed protein product [Cuscuta epithymum]
MRKRRGLLLTLVEMKRARSEPETLNGWSRRKAVQRSWIRPPPEPPPGPPLQDFSFKVEDLGLEELRAGSGDLFWEKEDEEMLTHPPPELPPWRNCASRVWKSISIFVLVCLCFYFDIHVVLVVRYVFFVKLLH